MARAGGTSDSSFKSRELFRFDDFNEYLLAPQSEQQSYEEIAEMLASVLQHLFPVGTPVEELDAFIHKQAMRPEVNATDRYLHPHKRISVKEYKNKVVYYYMFLFSDSVLDEYIENKHQNDEDIRKYMMLKMISFTWLLSVDVDNSRNIKSIVVRLDALAP